jgi:hypothetical protein
VCINDQVLPIHLQYFSHYVQETTNTMKKYSIWKTALEEPRENSFTTSDFVPTLLMLYDMQITFGYISITLHGEAIKKGSLNGFCFGTEFHLLQIKMKNFSRQSGAQKRLRCSRGCVLPSSTQAREFKPGRSRRLFQGEKIPSTSSFGGEVKPAVPCRRFTACKISLNVTWKSAFRQNSRLLLIAH